MSFPSRAFSLKDEGKLRKLTYLRLVVATLVIGVAIMVLQVDQRALSVIALYSLLGVIYLSTGSFYIAFKTGLPFRPLLYLQIFIDLVVLTLIIHYSGGASSYFTILYILPIITGGMYFRITGGLTAAIAAATIYVIYNVLELGGHIRSPLNALMIPAQGECRPMLRAYMNIIIFIFTGLLSGYVSRHIRKKGKELAERERELKHIQLNTDNIIRNMSSGLVVTNMTGEVLSLNPAAVSILGLGGEASPRGKLIEDVIPHMPALFNDLSSVLESGVPRRRHELEVIRADGGILPLGTSISILRGEGGEKKGVIALFQDLTEVHMMREKVRQADKMAAIGRLSAAIAHEIRAPLASICGSIEMLSGELELSGDNSRLMKVIIKESDRLDRIITDFLDFAKPRKPSFTPMNVEQCLNEVIHLLRHSSTLNRNVSMKVVSETKGIKIYADDEQIRQVFLNLGINACEAMRRENSLTIQIKEVVMNLGEGGQPGDCVRIDFKNDGPVIKEDVLPRVFEPFFTTKEEGTGLGLATAARIVESHSGLIKVESSESAGTIFSVILPVCVDSLNEREETLQEEFISF